MKNVYVVLQATKSSYSNVVCVTDDFDRASMEYARFSAQMQLDLTIVSSYLFEEGD